ncbi:hypothetical protein H6G74_11300 [Nostoc spongiaeforme FACHB-130]|uniref:Uncharacterized protein n=1 Tax=Nostoc spongiaeforme FACHB-130 TaxID=1357510 RepID=A0ABR8FXB7_9NOSO|nr:hypothetical protein [Nostoc spongiaeforme]MBD2594912.1 hypothetical protein [Nostoc spongiaeforme FACHB-130]
MSKYDFMSMTRSELRRYILEHREDEAAFQIYLDRFSSNSSEIFPAPQTIEDLDNFPQLHQHHLEKRQNQA